MFIQDASALDTAGRVIIALFFLWVAITNLSRARIKDHVDRLTLYKAPMPAVLFWVGEALSIVSALMVLTGWNARYGVMGLMLFIVLATALLLRFWDAPNPIARNGMRLAMLSNTAIFGGLLLLLQNVSEAPDMNAPVKSPKRLDPLPPEHSPELKEQFDSFFKSLGFVPNSVLTMQRKPKLVKAFVAMQAAIWDPESKVDRGLKRIIAHVASRTAQDEYSMAHTASGALHFGVDEKKLLDAWNYRDSALYTDAEKAALDLAVAAGSVPNKVTDELFARLRKYWSEEQIVEILAAVAMAGFLARWNTTMATPLEAEPVEVGEKYLAPRGWKAAAHRR